jgi:hypothetical protein
MAAAAVPAAYRLFGLPMPDSTPTLVATYIALLIAGYLVVKIICAPYFIWLEDQKEKQQLKRAFSSPEEEQRRYIHKALGEDHVALANAIARLRASMQPVVSRLNGAEAELFDAGDEVTKYAARLTHEADLYSKCTDVVHLSRIIVDCVRGYEDFRNEQREFYDTCSEVHRMALLIP